MDRAPNPPNGASTTEPAYWHGGEDYHKSLITEERLWYTYKSGPWM